MHISIQLDSTKSAQDSSIQERPPVELEDPLPEAAAAAAAAELWPLAAAAAAAAAEPSPADTAPRSGQGWNLSAFGEVALITCTSGPHHYKSGHNR